MTDDYLAFVLDNAVFAFGSALDAELENVEGKKPAEIKRKRERILQKWLGLPLKFRNPIGPTRTTRSTEGQD